MDFQYLVDIGVVHFSGSNLGAVAKGTDLKKPQEHEQNALLQAACKYEEIKPRSQFPSRLPGWKTWSESHPQRSEQVIVQKGCSPMHSSVSSLSVVSWNVLAQHMLQKNFEDPKSGYKHLSPEYVADVDCRQRNVRWWLEELSPDLIFLQEVDTCRFADHFEKPLMALGNDSTMQERDNNMCCATFWRRGKLSCMWDSSREKVSKKERQRQKRSLAHQFRFRGLSAQDFLVLNVHLDAARSQEGQEARALALDFALERLSAQLPGGPLLAIGDFNVNPDNQVMAVLRESHWHGFQMASAYEHPAAQDTSTVLEATCAICPYRDLFDQIWYRHSHLKLCQVLEALSPEERREAFRVDGPGLPNQLVPSDHAPVGAVFEVM